MGYRYSYLAVLAAILVFLSLIYWIPIKQHFFPKGEVRAALDIGSGSTNLKIAKVDPKTGKILSQIYEQSIRVPYQKQLELSGTNQFDQAIMDEGIAAIKVLKEMAKNYQVNRIAAVATAAFRQAGNAPAFTKEIEKETGVHVHIINQDEEGILAFRGALALSSSLLPENTVVWDIGGGSMQLTMLTKTGSYVVEKGKTASVPFKNAVIEKIKQEDLKVVQNPNPLSEEEIHKAILLAGEYAKEVSPVLKEKIAEPGTKIVAVGNLFNYGVRPLVGQDTVKQSALLKAVIKLAGQTFPEIKETSLAEVAATNPLLVAGYMGELKITQLNVINVNNTDGALTYPPYWQNVG